MPLKFRKGKPKIVSSPWHEILPYKNEALLGQKLWIQRSARQDIPVTRKHPYAVDNNDANYRCDDAAPQRCMCDPVPLKHIHGQVNIDYKDHCEDQQVPQAWTINGTASVCKIRDVEYSETLPKGVHHCKDKQFQVVSFIVLAYSVQFRVLQQCLPTDILIEDTDDDSWQCSVNY